MEERLERRTRKLKVVGSRRANIMISVAARLLKSFVRTEVTVE